jgi:hypothetical protein
LGGNWLPSYDISFGWKPVFIWYYLRNLRRLDGRVKTLHLLHIHGDILGWSCENLTPPPHPWWYSWESWHKLLQSIHKSLTMAGFLCLWLGIWMEMIICNKNLLRASSWQVYLTEKLITKWKKLISRWSN